VQENIALKGLKVIELAWVFMGPLITKILGDFGAEVIKIESQSRPDVMRSTPPFADKKPGMNRSGGYSFLNSSKYSLTLNLDKAEGIQMLRKLVGWADILVEGFTPGMARKWGITYEEVKKLNPGIIMISASMQGQTGPYSKQKGFGTFFQALPGFYTLTGRPHQAPPVPQTAYTDFIAPWYALVAILGAIHFRRRTGKGQYIDISQLETSVQFLSPSILDYTCNQHQQSANENRSAHAVPHNVYRCKGNDRWCAIAVFNDSEWQALVSAVGNPALGEDRRFSTFKERKKNEGELDELIGKWTIEHSPEEIMRLLQAAGITCGVVQSGKDLSEDPHLKESGFFQALTHPEMGPTTYTRSPFTLSEAPCQMKPAPCLGEHTEYICTEILGMSEDEFVELINAGVLE
jgi:crotonobetainyl-CoA:carnitine CoA-transferase CaiB-like acyl-CoA transferase